MTDTVQSFSALLKDVLGDRLDPGAGSFVEMFAEDGVMEFPYALPGDPERVEGRNALTAYLKGVNDKLSVDRMEHPRVIEAADPDTLILEFEGFGQGKATGEPYEQRYLAVIRTKDGRIVRYTDYWNPLALLRATRGRAAVEALTGRGGARG